jgi:hypothetical protein
MGRDPAEPAIADLFSTDEAKAVVPLPPTAGATKEARESALQRHILPKNLRHAVSQLSDGELDELFAVAFDEAKRRGRLPQSVSADLVPLARLPSELARKPPTGKRRQVDIVEVPLTRGQVNAIRAAFKAGISPSMRSNDCGTTVSCEQSGRLFNRRLWRDCEHCCNISSAQRIFAIVSTISIPTSASIIMEASMDRQPRGPDGMPITPKTGSY